VTSSFHLHITNARHELNIFMNGVCLKHDPSPIYLSVSLDRTLSYKEHLSWTAGKLRSRNNLISKLVDTTWGANASTLRTLAQNISSVLLSRRILLSSVVQVTWKLKTYVFGQCRRWTPRSAAVMFLWFWHHLQVTGLTYLLSGINTVSILCILL